MVSTGQEPAARRFFFALLVATTVVLAMVVRPIGRALFMAAVLAGVLAPLTVLIEKLPRSLQELANRGVAGLADVNQMVTRQLAAHAPAE